MQTIPVTHYLAIVNTPGYLPTDDDPAAFDTTRDAWQYLISEVDRAWDDHPEDESGACVEAHSQMHYQDQGTVGTVYAPTPGYDGDHDLRGRAVSVHTLARLGFEPGSDAESAWRDTLAGVVSRAAGSVCAVCGLERMGHAPEAEWLGYSRHDWSPVPATPDMIARANELTVTAYRLRRVACGHMFPSAACRRGKCVHVSGHCEHCL